MNSWLARGRLVVCMCRTRGAWLNCGEYSSYIYIYIFKLVVIKGHLGPIRSTDVWEWTWSLSLWKLVSAFAQRILPPVGSGLSAVALSVQVAHMMEIHRYLKLVSTHKSYWNISTFLPCWWLITADNEREGASSFFFCVKRKDMETSSKVGLVWIR